MPQSKATSNVGVVLIALGAFAYMLWNRSSLQKLRKKHLISSQRPKKAAIAFSPDLRYFDEAELERRVSVLGAMNVKSKAHGDISQFTKIRATLFDTTTARKSPSLVLKVTGGTVHDVFLASHFKRMPPYRAGHPQSAIPADTTFTGRVGFVYNESSSNRMRSYSFVRPESLDGHRHRSLAPPSRICTSSEQSTSPWLLEFANVWMAPEGEIYLPRHLPNGSTDAVDAYQFQGGCCTREWTNLVGKHIQVSKEHRRVPIGFSLAQNHGSSYSHVLQEVLPRLLTFWEVAVAVISARGGRIVGAEYLPVVRDFLRSFGVPDTKVLLFGHHDRRPIFFEKLFVPAPFLQDSYPHDCLIRTVGRVLAVQHAGDEPAGKPMVLLLERARARSADGRRCSGMRCMANFGALRDALRAELGGRVDVQTLSSRDDDAMRRGVRLFAQATVVVGVHGAGMSNILFMRGKGTHVIHLGYRRRWQMYAELAKKFDVGFVNILSQGASATGENVVADIPVVVLEVRRRLEREGVELDPPVMETNLTRNRLKSISLD